MTCSGIIPISKLLGNYNWTAYQSMLQTIIPISKLLGNYNNQSQDVAIALIIPISKLLGNYNLGDVVNITTTLYQYLNC